MNAMQQTVYMVVSVVMIDNLFPSLMHCGESGLKPNDGSLFNFFFSFAVASACQ